MNEIILIGRLGQDPIFKELENGKAICSFSIATNKKKTNSKGETREFTSWHSIVVFDELARLSSNILKKGIKVCVIGEVTTRTYTPKGKDFEIPKTEVHGKEVSVTLNSIDKEKNQK